MKKAFLIFALMLFGAVGLSADTVWSYDADDPLITNGNDDDPDNQFSCDFPEANEGKFSYMLDNDLTTFFTSSWEGTAPEPDDHPHWLQVDLQNRPQSKIIFTYSIRDDSYGQTNRPSTMIVYASNDGTTWTKVKEYASGELPTDFAVKSFTSGMIDLGTSCRYLRFAIPTTNGGGSIGNYPYFAIGEFQVYEATEVADAASILTVRLKEIKALQTTYVKGDGPGFYPADQVDALTTVIDKCDKYLGETHTDAEYTALLAELNTTFAALTPIPIKDGYYYIESANAAFKTSQPDVTKAMYAEGSLLYWGSLDVNEAKYVFHITSLGDNGWSIQNLGTGEYIKNLVSNNDQNDTQVATSKTQELPQYFQKLSAGQFIIYNAILQTNYGYNVQGHGSGAGISGTVCRWTSAADQECAWSLKEITDQDLINTLTDKAPRQALAAALAAAVNTAKTARSKTMDYTDLITNASQISSNAQSSGDGSSYANLIDGNTETIFHSVWDGSMKTVVTTGTGWHNLQFTLPYAISKMTFKYVGRNSDSWADSPDFISIYGTNDDALGASTAAADSTLWTQITDLTQGFPANGALTQYSSPVIDLGGTYKYLRFVVKHTTNEGKQSDRTFVVPEITGVTFNLSEIRLYDATPAANSEYYTVTGMKDACDALDALVAAAPDKIANLTATQADIDAMNAAADAVNKLYVDRDALDNEMAVVLDSAQKMYLNVSGSKVTLIKDVSQISTNNMSADDGSALANLIDGDLTTVFHSHWDTAMADAATTADVWTTNQESWVAANASNIAVGTGYHNLQIKLTQPVKDFYFEYVGRTGSDWHDSPNDILIFATNDDALGASVDAAEDSQWKEITELKDGFPEDIMQAEYTSPSIDLGDSYKYIRFEIKGTTHMGKVDSRMFAVPDITGITWNVEEWQMYTGLDPQRIQYNYVAGMKEAVDAMKTLMDADSQLGKHAILSKDPINKLRDAVNAVVALYADTTALVNLYNKYKVYADSSVVGAGIGFVDAQTNIDGFRSGLIEARNSVDISQPSKSSITAANDKMKDLFATFMTHVGQIVPNQWYNIITGSLRAYAQNQPVFLGSTSTGTKLVLGNYPIDQIDPKGDPYAIWRFVPIEGKSGQYAIQSMGTGQYFGPYRGQGADLSPLMDHAKTPYELQYYGNGKFKMIQVGVADDFDCLKADQTNMMVLNYPANGDSQQGWKFVPIPSDQNLSFNYMFENSIQIMTLPFALKGDMSLMNLNDGVKTYAVKYLNVTESGTTLGLKLQNDIEAGVPFIMMIGDYTLYDAANLTKHPVDFAMISDAVDTAAIVVNGLVGTLEGMNIDKSGLGIFVDSKFDVTPKGTTFIDGRKGYINPNLVTNEDGDADLVITTTALADGVKAILAMKATDKVNVYTIDGKLLKRNVKATDAQKNLSKGLYIIGKKKVAVK